MGDMGRCCYQEEVASQLCFYYALPEWGILVLYTLGETEGETERERERGGRARYNTLYQTQIYSNTDERPSGRNQTQHTTGRNHRPFSHGTARPRALRSGGIRVLQQIPETNPLLS